MSNPDAVVIGAILYGVLLAIIFHFIKDKVKYKSKKNDK